MGKLILMLLVLRLGLEVYGKVQERELDEKIKELGDKLWNE